MKIFGDMVADLEAACRQMAEHTATMRHNTELLRQETERLLRLNGDLQRCQERLGRIRDVLAAKMPHSPVTTPIQPN